MSKKDPKINSNKHKDYMTNAVTEIDEVTPDAHVPISSDRCVEDSRDFNEENKK